MAAPLVLENGLLYLRRYREYERRLALQLRRIASQSMPGTGIEPSRRCSRRCSRSTPWRPPGPRRRTRPAPHAAAGHRRPRHRQDHHHRPPAGPAHRAGSCTRRTPPRIALAAPTGRAADRMAESLRRAVAQMAEHGIDASIARRLAHAGQHPASPARHHSGIAALPPPRDNPLPFDIVVVDEASMVDLPLMCKLVDAVADGAQLILLGDPDQLPSVEAGDVLAAILAAAGDGDACPPTMPRCALRPPCSAMPTTWLSTAAGPAPCTATACTCNAAGARATRWTSRHSPMPCATAMPPKRAGLLRSGALANVHFHEDVEDPLQARPELLAHWRALATHADPGQACSRRPPAPAHRLARRPAGRARPQRRIEAALSGRRIGSPPAWFPGRLLLITENSYRHGLFNGDVGICLADADGTPLAWFPGRGEAKACAPSIPPRCPRTNPPSP
jgi:exodeoxyribonuclease V alpha subunit